MSMKTVLAMVSVPLAAFSIWLKLLYIQFHDITRALVREHSSLPDAVQRLAATNSRLSAAVIAIAILAGGLVGVALVRKEGSRLLAVLAALVVLASLLFSFVAV